ncbi:Hpt domain protein [Maioricimonas rarisocia]|uniref:Hpt domain protein n=1 Tax=Maioricimonas rarisocia TaxID=2528026 RepID=A0A517ZEH8_9PLAN|nr:Hpt domain-containing protein [Maioricimonas rarisocia]QDU40890.1 Hpt domain protein [Maioricimonas rarisocia]
MTGPRSISGETTGEQRTTEPAFSLQEVLENVCGDRELFSELVTDFLLQAPGLLLKIRAAAATRDGEGVMREAHTLKGSVSLLAARTTFETALELERRGRDNRFDGIGDDVDCLGERVETLLRELEATLANE